MKETRLLNSVIFVYLLSELDVNAKEAAYGDYKRRKSPNNATIEEFVEDSEGKLFFKDGTLYE